SCFHATLVRAQFFFRGSRPFHLKSTTRAPAARAISAVASVLPESTTTMSSHQATDARQAGRLAASLRTGINTEMGAGAGMSAGFRMGAGVKLGIAGATPEERAECEEHRGVGKGEFQPGV